MHWAVKDKALIRCRMICSYKINNLIAFGERKKLKCSICSLKIIQYSQNEYKNDMRYYKITFSNRLIWVNFA